MLCEGPSQPAARDEETDYIIDPSLDQQLLHSSQEGYLYELGPTGVYYN